MAAARIPWAANRYWRDRGPYLPARLSDNPDLAETGYGAVLAGLPPELRAAYRDGNFGAGLKDHEFQVIPTAWIEAAQARWQSSPPAYQGMTAMGVDIAQGGNDRTVIAARYGGWYAPLVRKPGKECRTGTEVVALIVQGRRNNCPVVIDVGGGIPVVPYRGLMPSLATTRDGNLKFANKRAEDWWRMREELNPDQQYGSAIALPPDASIKADLAASRFEVQGQGIKIEAKDEIRKRLGHSPDDGDAIVMAMNEGGKAAAKQATRQNWESRPQRANVGYADIKRRYSM